MLKKDLKKLIKSMQQSAPINNLNKLVFDNVNEEQYYKPLLKNLKYPYKPVLMISLLNNLKEVNQLFNKWINLEENENIIKNFYNLLSNSDIFTFVLRNTDKSDWIDCYNQKTKKSIINFIFTMPAVKMQVANSNVWEINKKTKSIRINLDGDLHTLEEAKKELEDASYVHLKKCIPEYVNLNVDEINNYDGWVFEEINTYCNDSIEANRRRYQNYFRKQVINRDEKCIICCLDNNILLEACHIKPYAKCEGKEKYDCNNGITLCRNHHKLFDAGYFSFSDQWKVVLSKKTKTNDADLLIKEFEPCFSKIVNNKNLNNEYLRYHFKNILIK